MCLLHDAWRLLLVQLSCRNPPALFMSIDRRAGVSHLDVTAQNQDFVLLIFINAHE